MATGEQRNKSNNRAALVAMGVTVGMVSCVMFTLVMFCRWWIPRSANSFEPCTIPLQQIETKNGNKLVDSHLKAIAVKINDVNGLMLLDTGANRTMLSLDFCKKHSLWGRWVKLNPNTTNMDGTHIFYAEEDLRIGPLKFRNFPFFAFEINLLPESPTGMPLIGILGTDILNRFNYSIDFQDNLLRIGVEDDLVQEDNVRIPISIRNNKIYVNMDIQERTFEFILDTGSNRAKLSEAHLDYCAKDIRKREQTWQDINGAHTETVKQVELSDIHLGQVCFEKFTFTIRGDENWISAAMLKDLTVTIYPAEKYMTVESSRTQQNQN
jgi:hypothetical protein